MKLLDELIWKMFDTMHVNFPEESVPEMERFSPMRFYREQHVFRMGDFGNRIIELSHLTELPTGSILHILDDVQYPTEHSDVPRVKDNIFLQKESFQKKYIYHLRDLDLDGPVMIDDKFIFRPAGLPSIFMKFRSEHKAFFRYLNMLSEIPTSKECLVVINHNPLFRTQVFGRYQFFRKIQLILTSILNTTHRLQHLDKQQFIQIPWGQEVYDKQLFIRTRTKLDPIVMRRPDSFHFIMMMHLLNFMWNEATSSIFNQLPPEDFKQINLIIQLNDKYIFYNLADLLKLNEKNRAFFRCCNQLNMLSLVGRVTPESGEVAKEEAAKFIKKVSEDIPKNEETSETAVPPDTTVHEEPVVKEEFVPRVETTAATTDKEKPAEEEKTADAKAAEIIQKAAVTIPVTVKPIAVTPVSVEIPHTHAAVKETKSGSVEEVAPKVTFNATSIRTENAHKDVHMHEFISTVDKTTEQFINSRQELTPKEKNRYKLISQKYKSLTLGGERLDDILENSSDMSLEQDDLNPAKIGYLPDASGLKSSLAKFDKTYMDKTFKKHLVSTAIAFQPNGVFLTGIKEEREVSEMNNVTHYSFRYEDVEGRQSTVKFKFPTVDAEGKVLIDGVKQVLKKQRVALPIVKISDTEISLASNQNKTRVVRNENKAHNYFSFVDSLVNSDKSNATVEFGSYQVNLPLAYEYSSLAERYKKISFNNGGQYEFYFDYGTRLTHFGKDQETLSQLEKVYGVYVGSTTENWLFIDNQNTVRAIQKSGGEDVNFPYTSLLQMFLLSLKDGASFNKTLSEWISIKILDKQLPVIFVLAYRYGLRNTLDYMGIKYRVTEGRSKIIVGENTPSMEAIDSVKEKQITFPEDEIATLQTQDHITTTRVDKDFDKFKIGDIVMTPWGEKYKVTDREVFADVKDHPFYAELTEEQRDLIREYPEFAVLTLEKQEADPITGDKRYSAHPDDIAIRFADRVIWINRYPLAHSLVVAGLEYFDLSMHDLASFESKDVYFQLLQDRKCSANYLKGIDAFFESFIDGMTFSTLKMMKEPTNVRDLLLRCATLLSTLDYRPPSSRLNFRIRGYEQLNAILYNEMARQYAAYKTRRGKANAFSINPDAVFLRIIQNASMVPSESVNPLQDIKEMSYMTYAGVGGRTSDSFVVTDRKYSADDIGVISEATVDNQKVGINAQLSLDPGIVNTMGVLEPKPLEELKPANVLSAHALVFPFSTHDDTKRIDTMSL